LLWLGEPSVVEWRRTLFTGFAGLLVAWPGYTVNGWGSRLFGMSQNLHDDNAAAMAAFKRALGWWPYIFISVSVIGLLYIAYIALNSAT